MTDDPKIVHLQTGYIPEEAPIDASEIQQLRWDIALLADEIKQLSVLLSKQVRGMAVLNNKLNGIDRHIQGK